MTAPTATTQHLTPSEQRLAQHVVESLNAREIANVAGLKPTTIYATLRTVRWKMNCPARCPLAVVAHHLLAAGEIAAPAPQRPAPDLSAEQDLLLL
ncbi:hypothetical protein [Streptomyces sp. NPDC046821]|uniref:hypothetical protein n=1 Tax=Streptomyces sp. NPDC046821 TaxID=3154702 RepID=UPI0033C59DF7